MSLGRAVATVGGFTLLSRLVGFIRDIVLSAVLGRARWPTPSS
jgi:putative peptidoglycan lipid II flippase